MRIHAVPAQAVSGHGKGAFALFAALSTTVFSTQALAAPTTHTIVIEAMAFSPKVLEVKVGDTIEWINQDAFPHNATTVSGGFKSTTIAPNASWKFTARKKGSFPYVCTFHPMMMARVIVK
jgi:plastocyanin